jgi:hypothetical protein
MSGVATSSSPIRDGRTGVTAANSLRLNRNVEVREWRAVKVNNEEKSTLEWATSNSLQQGNKLNPP